MAIHYPMKHTPRLNECGRVRGNFFHREGKLSGTRVFGEICGKRVIALGKFFLPESSYLRGGTFNALAWKLSTIHRMRILFFSLSIVGQWEIFRVEWAKNRALSGKYFERRNRGCLFFLYLEVFSLRRIDKLRWVSCLCGKCDFEKFFLDNLYFLVVRCVKKVIFWSFELF